MVGDDDGRCDLAVDGQHRLELAEVVEAGAGVALVSACQLCGTLAYDASAGDDPRRPPLADD